MAFGKSSIRLKFFAAALLAVAAGGCASALEVVQAAQEPPSVEMALDRINTAARLLELEEIMLRAMPISAASAWPEKSGKIIPGADYGRLGSAASADAIFSPNGPFRPSIVRIKVLAIQTILFESAPDLYYERKFADKEPSPDAIREYGKKVLGEHYNPAFNIPMYRFLKRTPGFMPKREHFEAKLDGRAVDYFPGMEDAVISLAENGEQLKKIRGSMDEVSDSKKRALRDIEDNSREIQKLKDADERKNAPDIAALEEEIKTHRKEYDDAAAKYGELLKTWRMELEKIKTQSSAFDADQAALAKNVQASVDAIKSLHYDAIAVISIAALRLPDSLANLDKELQRLMRSPFANERIKRIVQSLAALKDNVMIIKNEMFQLYDETGALDGLFEQRLKAVVSVNKANNAAPPPAPVVK